MRKVLYTLMCCTFASPLLPLLFMHDKHNCRWDECVRLCYHYDAGPCVMKVINDACEGLTVMWFWVIAGGFMVMDKSKESVSPSVFAAALLACCIFMGVLDPSKRAFAWASAVPAVLFFATWVVYSIYDKDK